MLFNSFTFIAFLPLVFALHWAARNATWRNAVLLAASYVFYGAWDVRFLALIVLSTATDFFAGHLMTAGRRKLGLALSLGVNLGVLLAFKYAGFFVESWVSAWEAVGVAMPLSVWQVVLPVGISFYTFQTLSYTLDVYRGQIPAERNPLAFATFVAFFPQLIAGPIERAGNLLPQFTQPRAFSLPLARSGLRLILWGLFKKVLVADTCAPWADAIFEAPDAHSGPVLALGALLFAFQIYGDFSGYSDIAVGTARLFGVQLSPNFNFPYFATDIGSFWRRWHMTLTAWFRDYVYIPLGGSRHGAWKTYRNTAAVFLLSGLWHGANWTFVAWGAVHALLYLPVVVARRAGPPRPPAWPRIPRALGRWATTFAAVTMAWVFFRAADVGTAWIHLRGMFDASDWRQWEAVSAECAALARRLPFSLERALWGILALVAAEAVMHLGGWKARWHAPALWPLRWALYAVIASQIHFRLGAPQGFIYFQF